MRRIALATALLLGLTWTSASAITTEALLDTLQHTAFDFFWNEANPSNGLIKDRSTAGSASSIAATGFGLTGICIGIDHGWITREQGRDRVLTTLNTFWLGPQSSASSGTIGHKGFFYHFLDMTTATRAGTSELSSIDTALLLAGVLDCRQYFNGVDATETEIRTRADAIYQRVDWNFMRNLNPGILMGWKPGTGFLGFGQWIGYNEAMILYLLALGSPTFAVPTGAWDAWTSGYLWDTYYGYSYIIFAPLFGHQYSHCWVDFRYIQDDYTRTQGLTYFENSRRATLAQQAYSIDNPGGFVGYSATLWGITASDVPSGYAARGAPPAFNDEGTITPTAPGGSIAFAPEIVIPTLQNMFENYPTLWTSYGFRDAFNPTVGWWGPDVLGIDQGPILIMIENHRTGSVWDRFMENANIQTGLDRAGFTGAVDVPLRDRLGGRLWLEAAPNPAASTVTVRYRLPAAGQVRLRVHDVTGRAIATLVDEEQPAGEHAARLRVDGWVAGVYLCRLESAGEAVTRKLIVSR